MVLSILQSGYLEQSDLLFHRQEFPGKSSYHQRKRAFEVISMNRKGMKPDSLFEEERKPELKKPIDLLEQESVTRFDRNRNKEGGNNANRNNKKKKKGANNDNRPQSAENANRGEREKKPTEK